MEIGEIPAHWKTQKDVFVEEGKSWITEIIEPSPKIVFIIARTPGFESPRLREHVKQLCQKYYSDDKLGITGSTHDGEPWLVSIPINDYKNHSPPIKIANVTIPPPKDMPHLFRLIDKAFLHAFQAYESASS